ncbi:hypothetical protein Tco_0779772 [Tanacetum coccineum]
MEAHLALKSSVQVNKITSLCEICSGPHDTQYYMENSEKAFDLSYCNDDKCFSIDVIDEILEEYFDALLNEGSNILYSIEGTPLEEKLFAKFDKFMAMTVEEKSESNSNKEEIRFEKITFDTNYKIKTSLEEPPLDLELKELPEHLEYVFLEEPSFLPMIISSQLSEQNKDKSYLFLKSTSKPLLGKQQAF